MSNELEKLNIFQDEATETKYAAILNKRITNLELYKENLATSNLKKYFDGNIELTKECDQIAKSLKNAYVNLAKTLPVETEEAVDRVIAHHVKTINQSPVIKKLSKQIGEYHLAVEQKDEFELAKKVLLEAITSKDNGEKTMLELVDSKYPEDDSFERVSLRLTIALLTKSYQTYMYSVLDGAEYIKLSKMIHNMLYVEIMDIDSKADKKNVIENLKKFSGEVAEVFAPTFISNIISIFKMVKTISDTVSDLHKAEVPETIKEISKLESHLSKYQESLIAWKSTANSLITQLESIQNILKEYQID